MVLTTGSLLMVAHHEGLRPHPEERAPARVSKDEATELENAPKHASHHASESRGRVRSNSAAMMMIFTAFHASPFMNAAA